MIRIQPDEAIYLKINNKVPGLGLNLDVTKLDLTYRDRFEVLARHIMCLCAFAVSITYMTGMRKTHTPFLCQLSAAWPGMVLSF